MAEVAPVKFKRRKVSAVRDFPVGCGPNAAPLTPQKRPRDDTADLLKTPKPEPLVELPNSEESPQEDGKGDYTLTDSSVKLESANFLNGVSDHGEPTIAPLVNEDFVEKQHCLKLYPLPKRRKVSAVRDFPAGCGPDAPQLKRDENLNKDGSMEVDGAVKNVLLENHQVEMDQDLASQKVEKEAVKGGSKHVSEDPAKSTTFSPKSKSMDGDLKSKSMDGEMKTPVKDLVLEGSMKVTDIHKDEGVVAKGEAEQIPDVQNRTSSEAAAKIAPAPLKSRSKDVEKKPMVKQRLSSEGPINVISAGKSQGDVKRNDAEKIREKAKEMSNEAQFKSALESTLGAGTAEEHSDKKFLARSTAEKKLEGREETRSDTQVKSAPKSGLGEKTAEERKEKKVQARSTPERKLDGHGVKLVSQRILVKEASDTKPHLDTKSQSGSKSVFKEASSSAGKMIKKHQSDTKVPKRKFSEEEKSKEPIARGQMAGNSPVVVNGDRLIVQALMAAENCPWRQGRNSVRVNSRSAPPKSSVKKERKLLSNSTIMGASASKLMDGIDGEDKEDGEEYEKTLVLYNGPRELSVTMPPLVPPKHEHKGSDDELSERGKVKRTLRLFQMLVRKFVKDEESKKMDLGRVRVDYKAADILKKNNWSLNPRKAILGHVPGVEVGDEFHYRVEIALVGLHRPYQGGIDSTKMDDDTSVATSIVASCGYADDIDSSDVLIYSGSGGNPEDGCKQAEDQKLERGNLALKNSIELGTPVRVIRGFKEAKALSTFTYDGLYVVEDYWKEEGRKGFSVLKFQLRRMAGQPELSLKEVKRSKKAKEREGLRVEDISQGKESIPICAVNTIDDDVPMPFKYTSKNIYPSWHVSNLPRGCECIGGCSDSDKCACAVKNGGEIPFNQNGAIVQAKPLVYECGPTCKCPQSCPNRVSQHGIRRPLEIFKTESRGWGVRSLYSIPSGSFICEYIGELLKDSEAEQRSNDEYLFDIGHNYEDRTLWEGLPSLIPGLQANSPCETVDDAGFTIDAAEFGNVGRFINHSCSPNIYAQNVLYDHDDKRMPHIMFFAADNIPPLQELTYHYNYTVDQVRDSEGNIKQKNCYCGAPDCTGRLY